MPKDNLFDWINACWNKAQPEGTPPIFVMHRFMASDPDLAQAARVLHKEVRDPKLIFKTWQGLLPKGRGAPSNPRLQYMAAKKRPAEEELTARMCKVLGERREVVEDMIAVLDEAGRGDELYTYFGVKHE